tara:strand:- start:1 stop:438 length:438 start_codon:yes stop_codon:yes gene_type:complete
MNSISGASLAVNQEYVNKNINKIVEFMVIVQPELSSNSQNWKRSLLKDYKPKEWIVLSYQKYTEGVNMMNNYTERINRFYDKELLLEEREKREENALIKQIDINEKWREIANTLREQLISEMGRDGYEQFLDESGLSKHSSYFGL